MKSRLALLLSAATMLAGPAFATDINQDTANSIQQSLTKYLPKEAVDTGFIKVTPGSERYELAVDLQALIDHYKPKEFTIAGLKPFIHFLTPRQDGLWDIEANQTLDVTGTLGEGTSKVDFGYKIDSMMFKGAFDPAITYLSDGTMSALGGRLTTKTGNETSEAQFGEMSQVVKTTRLTDTHADLAATGTIASWKQTMSSAETGPFSFTADSVDFKVDMKNFGIVPLRDLIVFALDHMAADKLDAESAAKLKEILKANIPLTDNLGETITVNKMSVEAQGMVATVDKLAYTIDFGGIKRDSHVGFGVTVEKPNGPAALMMGLEKALPDVASFNVRLTDLNLGDAANYFLEHADLTAAEPLTPTENDEIGKIVVPDGKLHVSFDDTYAKSSVYDVSLSGTMLVDAGESNKASADVTIKANNLDATIKFLQDNAGTMPELGQAAFGAQMMKGFAKQEADGAFVWHIEVDEAGQVKINGQPFGG